MKITYIHHSSFSVEFEEAIFLFDYYKGKLPDFDLDKKLYVFVSHKHGDHFNLEMFKVLEKYPNITYILSNDIKFNEKYLIRKGIPVEVKEKSISIGKNKTIEVEELTIETLKSTDEGVAFIVSYRGKTIYHGGDLNWWHWEGEEEQDNLEMEKSFKGEIDKIQGRTIDVGFIPLDPRQEENFYLGFDYFMKKTNTKIAFPMHFWENYSVCSKIKNLDISKGYRDSIMDISEENQEFSI